MESSLVARGAPSADYKTEIKNQNYSMQLNQATKAINPASAQTKAFWELKKKKMLNNLAILVDSLY